MSDESRPEGPGGCPDRADRPVAAVVVETPLAHLDRIFEYSVPEELSAGAVPGARVRVRFAGRDLEGFVVERRAAPEHSGRLSPLRRVVSPEPVLTPQLYALCRAVADRYAGTLSDVLRLAVPKRHATAERNLPLAPADPPPAESRQPGAVDPGPWAAYPAGPAWLRRVAAGEAPAAAWSALPTRTGEADWPYAFAVAAQAALSGGRSAVFVVPDHGDVDRLDAALVEVLGRGRHVRLTSAQGPQARYTAWLKVLRGHVKIVVGTRAAAYAPVQDLGLVAWWDDGDDLHEEPRAPYHHIGVVLGIRAEQTGAALLAGGHVRSLRVQVEVEEGRLAPVSADPGTLRAAAPRVVVAGEGTDEERDGPAARAHLPSRAWRVAKDALRDGPVLVQVPRRGYLPSVSCGECRASVRCGVCHGPVAVGAAGAVPACRWCGQPVLVGAGARLTCRRCGSSRLRASVTGAGRTAEELGRAFAGHPVVTSGGREVVSAVPDEPTLVVATPGAEPVAAHGYSAVLLLDAWASVDLPVLDAGIESLRRWAAAAALVRPGRTVVLCGAPEGVTLPPVEALVRWDPVWLAERELADRRELGLPPAVRMAQLTAPRRVLDEALGQLDLPAGAQLLGPMPWSPRGRAAEQGPARAGEARDAEVVGGARGSGVAGVNGGTGVTRLGGVAASAGGGPVHDRHALIRIDAARTAELSASLRALKAFRSARKESAVVGVRVDPTTGL